MWLVWAGAPLLAVLFGLASSAWLASIIVFAVGLLLMVGNILWESLLQSEVPKEILGRVSSVDWMVSLGLSPIGVAVAGVASGIVGIRATIIVPGVVISVLSLLPLIFVRSLTSIDRRLFAPET
jgi:hypothetical protein